MRPRLVCDWNCAAGVVSSGQQLSMQQQPTRQDSGGSGERGGGNEGSEGSEGEEVPVAAQPPELEEGYKVK